MEVTVVDASNIPAKGAIAINMGNVRRHANLGLNNSIHIPGSSTGATTVEVSMMRQLASWTLSQDQCIIPISSADGNSSEVRLGVQRGGAGNGFAKVADNGEDVHLAKEYLDEHKLQQRLQDLIQDVLRVQPDDPYKYMLKRLKETKANGGIYKPVAQTSPGQAEMEKECLPAFTPKPPPSQAPAAKGPRAVRDHQAAEACKDEKESPKKSDDVSEVRQAARMSITALMCTPKVTQEAEESWKIEVQKSEATSLSDMILRKAMDNEVQNLQNARDDRHVAKVAIRDLLQRSARLLGKEYQASLVQWSVQVALRGAVNTIVLHDEMRQACFGKDYELRRMSLPVPVVYLCSGKGSWGSWLNNS